MSTASCNLLVIGSGAAAMTAALRAAKAGLKVLMVEKEEVFGGASARAAGGIWIPNNLHARKLGGTDSLEKARTYFLDQAGARHDEARVSAFLDHSPEMLNWVEENSSLRFEVAMGYGDYHCEAPGGETCRVLFPRAWDGSELGDRLPLLRPPLRRPLVMGMQVGILEAGHFLAASRSFSSMRHVLKLMARRGWDQLRAGRSLRLNGGNALIGGLASACFRNGVELWTASPARDLIREHGRVTGAMIEHPSHPVRVEATHGVLLAAGGFPHDSALRAAMYPKGARRAEIWNPYPFGNSGDGIRMAQTAGGAFDDDMLSPVAFVPTARLCEAEGVIEADTGFFLRGAPGVISVTRRGFRFVNESRSYHDWGVALLDATAGDPECDAWMVCDHRALRRYGLGAVKPAPLPFRRFVESGYLKTGRTVRELARNAGIDPDNLERTIAAFNGPARKGLDPVFHRGSTPYELTNGDPAHRPNPCVGPLEKAPYYAIRVTAGCIGTFAGIRANAHAQVIDWAGEPVPGLYVAGADMASITGGDYIAGGCMLGPAMTFGYIAAGHLVASHGTDRRARGIDRSAHAE